MPLFALTIFLSAFLLFLVQPLLSKAILPWFGGTAAVWATCLMFFQLGLLLGYLYAYGSIRFLKPRTQRWVHLVLLGISLLFLPIFPNPFWKPSGTEDPAGRILLLLAATVGLPYLMLSTTGPLLQAWAAEHRGNAPGTSRRGARRKPSSPYRLYALSNAGSLLALIGYPLAMEVLFPLRSQAMLWSIGYVVFAVCCGALASQTLPEKNDLPAESPLPPLDAPSSSEEVAPGWPQYLLWIALSSCSSVLLLAITNHLTVDVSSIPLLWVLPLGLYLLSFIICFGVEQWEWKPLYLLVPPLTFASLAFSLSEAVRGYDPLVLILQFLVGLFVCCMVCHGELARRKPAPRYLTSYYLMMALGGALGGSFVAFVAPRLFPDYYELPLGIGGCALLALFAVYPLSLQGLKARRGGNAVRLLHIGLSLFTAFLLSALLFVALIPSVNAQLMVRNFYGVLRVAVNPPGKRAKGPDERMLELRHGTTRHGAEFLRADRRRWPTTYYGPNSGVGLAFRTGLSRAPRRVGVIGLGAGTLAAYARPGDTFRFYEINPLIVQLARTRFDFLKVPGADIGIVMGDARLSLERETPQAFNLLAVDAFSSDSIPVHLLTREAFEQYFRHMSPGGILAVHISNKYLDLEPVVGAAARALGKEARVVVSGDNSSMGAAGSTWILLTDQGDFFRIPVMTLASRPLRNQPSIRLWTDDYSNLIQIFRAWPR